jgi:hypothetical protein
MVCPDRMLTALLVPSCLGMGFHFALAIKSSFSQISTPVLGHTVPLAWSGQRTTCPGSYEDRAPAEKKDRHQR